MANPDYSAYCSQLWGWPEERDCYPFFGASNVVVGTNPPYQASDFLSVYPKFGTAPQGVNGVAVAVGGSGYNLNDTLTPVQPDSQGAVITVSGVVDGAVIAVTIQIQGSGYSVATGVATTTIGSGTGCTLNITAITPANLVVPANVLAMYIAMASASLQQARWLELWPFGMAEYIAHFCTLYLVSEGNPGSTPGAIARSGLAIGIIVSQSAGDVSKTIEPPEVDGFAQWHMTVYGQKFAFLAKHVGSGPMLLY
jgi:hypothetical protein